MADTANFQNADMEKIAAASHRQLIDYLEDLLIRQIERIRQYDLDNALSLAEEANECAEALGQNKILDQPEYSDDRFRIKQLYKDIELIISAERQEVADKLKQIRKGIKALGIYGENK
jgi:hypothetical protein